jgi:uncharacterized protein YdaU (DUF1376 family)
MNHYPRHIGDYLKKTSHLSLLEHGVYTRLLDVYYIHEGPIPEDQVARLIGAKSREERAAMEVVLREFFQLEAGFYRQGRADEEIATFQAGEPEREVKKANETLRLKRHREERAALFAQLHEHGLHADWNIKMVDLRAMVQRHCNVTGNADTPLPETPPATAPATPATANHTQYPVPSTHTQGVKRTSRARRAPATPMPPDFAVSPAVEAWAAERGYADLGRHLESFRTKCQAKGYTYADWDAAFRNAVADDWAGLRGARGSPAVRGHGGLAPGAKDRARELLFGGGNG